MRSRSRTPTEAPGAVRVGRFPSGEEFKTATEVAASSARAVPGDEAPPHRNWAVAPARPGAPGRLQYARGSEQRVREIESQPEALQQALSTYHTEKYAAKG